MMVGSRPSRVAAVSATAIDTIGSLAVGGAGAETCAEGGSIAGGIVTTRVEASAKDAALAAGGNLVVVAENRHDLDLDADDDAEA